MDSVPLLYFQWILQKHICDLKNTDINDDPHLMDFDIHVYRILQFGDREPYHITDTVIIDAHLI